MILNSKVRNTHNLNLFLLRFPRFCKMQGLKNAGISVYRDKNAGIENSGIRKWRDWEMQGWKCRDWHPRDKTPGMASISRALYSNLWKKPPRCDANCKAGQSFQCFIGMNRAQIKNRSGLLQCTYIPDRYFFGTLYLLHNIQFSILSVFCLGLLITKVGKSNLSSNKGSSHASNSSYETILP